MKGHSWGVDELGFKPTSVTLSGLWAINWKEELEKDASSEWAEPAAMSQDTESEFQPPSHPF